LKIDPNELTQHLAELFVICKTSTEFCQNIVQSPVIGHATLGAQLVTLGQDGSLRTLPGFGIPYLAKRENTGALLTLWDDHPVSIAIREGRELKAKVINPKTGRPAWLFVYPYARPSHAVGAAITLKDKDYSIQLNPSIQQTLSLMGALWLEVIGENQPDLLTPPPTFTEDITPRQAQVLALIAQGKTNQEIAEGLFLSESTIRQETVKIFRTLGVATRDAAANKGINLGLIAKSSNLRHPDVPFKSFDPSNLASNIRTSQV
jgi:DNA-binding CsgD family transcriptional regulator